MPVQDKEDALNRLDQIISEGQILMLDARKIFEAIESLRLDIVENSLPNGVIVAQLDSATRVPSGWFLCDGTNGTPDLSAERLRYIMKNNPQSFPTNTTRPV